VVHYTIFHRTTFAFLLNNHDHGPSSLHQDFFEFAEGRFRKAAKKGLDISFFNLLCLAKMVARLAQPSLKISKGELENIGSN
jgi:hypothetical protein